MFTNLHAELQNPKHLYLLLQNQNAGRLPFHCLESLKVILKASDKIITDPGSVVLCRELRGDPSGAQHEGNHCPSECWPLAVRTQASL